MALEFDLLWELMIPYSGSLLIILDCCNAGAAITTVLEKKLYYDGYAHEIIAAWAFEDRCGFGRNYSFASVTCKVLARHSKRQGLSSTGLVNEVTAEMLEILLPG
jgi:hypothetical protein